MNAKIIGMGAAGNKAAIALIEKGLMTESQILLINSTLRDIPSDYKNLAIQLSAPEDDASLSYGGCGKERTKAKKLVLNSFKNDTLSVLDSFLDPTDDMVIIVNSSEGGTGCGGSSIVADYIHSSVGAHVHMFVFTGFEEDGRGLQNTVEYFQELSEEYTVEAISNKKFLSNGGNKLRAEKAANDEFVERVSTLLGMDIVDSEQNIDDTDLFKVSNTPGFMTIEHGMLDKIKNVNMFNEAVIDIIDNSKSLDISELSAKRIAVILNISEKTSEFIDYSFAIIKERYGVPYEVFTHIQNEGDEEYIKFIISGMNMPIDEVKDIYNKYVKASENVNKTKDGFFDFAKGLKGNSEDSMFNMDKIRASNKNNKDAFLNKYNLDGSSTTDPKTGFQNTNKKSKEEFLNQY